MDLDGPQRVLAPNTERFFELLTTVEHLPEFARQIEDALRALSARGDVGGEEMARDQLPRSASLPCDREPYHTEIEQEQCPRLREQR